MNEFPEASLGHEYFTAIEDHFRWARGSGLFLLSSLDFHLVKTWQAQGIPLKAVLRGIDRTFENLRKSPARAQFNNVNSLAYCAQEIAKEVQILADAGPVRASQNRPRFTIEDVRGFVRQNINLLRKAGYEDIARLLEMLDLGRLYLVTEELEHCLVSIENTMIAKLRGNVGDNVLREARCALEKELKPYRARMSADQLSSLEKLFMERNLLQSAGLPRLSLFYAPFSN